MNKELFIHLGLPKTGTSFLQRDVFPNIKNINFLHRFIPHNIRNIVSFKLIPGKLNLISDEIYSVCNFSKEVEAGAFIVAERINKMFPDAKIMIVFRDKEAWKKSLYRQYEQEIYMNLEPWYHEIKRKHPVDFSTWEKTLLYDFDFKEYEKHLKTLFKNVLVLKYEDFKTSPETFIKKMCDFMGCKVPEYKERKRNPSVNKKQLLFFQRISQIKINCLRIFLITLFLHIFARIEKKSISDRRKK